MNTTTQNAEFTVMHFPQHLRAGDAVARPVQLLFDDEVLNTTAALYMNATTARRLAAALLAHADAAEVA